MWKRRYVNLIASAFVIIAIAVGDKTAASAADAISIPAEGFSGILDYLNGPGVPGPLSPLGEHFREIGITPKLGMLGLYMFNSSMGQETGHSQRVNIFTAGFDADLERMLGLEGSSLHFLYAHVPDPHNNGTFRSYAGDSMLGQAAPYIGANWHLNQLTWEQKLFDNRLTTAFGIDNAGRYFARPLCNQAFLCQATLLDATGIYSEAHSNWSARLAYDLTPEWTVQFGFSRSNPYFPFTDGWEGWGGTVDTPFGTMKNPNSNLFLANLVYETTPRTDTHPRQIEVMLYFNDAQQTNPATGEVHDGTSGGYLGGKQTIWRASDDPMAASLSIYGSLYGTFDPENSFGIGHELNTGVILQGPWAERPFDSYSLNFAWNHLTSAKQTQLINSNTGQYSVGPDEFAVGVDANIVLAGSMILQPWAKYIWNVNTFHNPSYDGNPKDGWAFGVNIVALLDKTLGLSTAPATH